MLKKYTAKSHVAVSVTLPSGGSKHISFSQLTGGSSVYYTEDPDEQYGLERHRRYGKLYKGEIVKEAIVAPKPIIAASEKNAAPLKSVKKVAAGKVGADGIEVVKVACLDDAKEYLCDRYSDIQRTKLRGKASIMNAAAAHNIKFEGI